jgi:hypothetical protein
MILLRGHLAYPEDHDLFSVFDEPGVGKAVSYSLAGVDHVAVHDIHGAFRIVHVLADGARGVKEVGQQMGGFSIDGTRQGMPDSIGHLLKRLQYPAHEVDLDREQGFFLPI